MIDHPCVDCTKHFLAKDVSAPHKSCWVCTYSPGLALILDSSAVVTIRELGCLNRTVVIPSEVDE